MATEVTSGAAVISSQPHLPTELLTNRTRRSDAEPKAQPVASLKCESPLARKEVAGTLETLNSHEMPSKKPQFASYLPQPVMPIVHNSALQAPKPDLSNKSPRLTVYLSDEMSNVLTIQAEAQMFEDRPSKSHSQSVSSLSSASSEAPSLVSSQRSSQDLTTTSPGAESCSVQPVSPPKNDSEDSALLPTFSQLDSQLPSALKTRGFSLPKLQPANKYNQAAAKHAERPREEEALERKRRNSGEQTTPFKHISTEPQIQQAIPIQPARTTQSTRRIAKKPEKVKKHEPKRKHSDAYKGPRIVPNSDARAISHHAGQVPFHSVYPPSGQSHPPLLSPMHIPYEQSLHPLQMPLPQMFQHPSYPYAVQSSLMIRQHPVHQMQPSMPPPMWPPNQQLSSGISTAVQMQLMHPQQGQAVQVSTAQPEPSSSLPDLHDNRPSLHSHGPHHFPLSIPHPHPASHYPLQGYPQVLSQSQPASQPGPRLVPFQPFQESLLSDQSRSSSSSPQQQTSSFANDNNSGNINNQSKTREPWDIEVVASSSWQPGFTQDIKMRTKTGCLTCRRRRVKCDEKRPHCRNCLKSERVCLGYDTVFTRARNKRIEDLSSKRRACRNSWKMRISALLEAGHTESEDDDTSCFGTRPVVVRTWLRLVELFRDHVARDLDLLLGTDFLLVTAHRGANHLSSHNGSLISMASELEAMRQIMVVVFPTVESSTLNILDANLPLEKLKTSDGYYVMQAIVESLSPDFRDHLAVPTRVTKRQQHDQPELMETWFMRLTLLGKLLHPQKGRFFPFSWKHRYTLYEMASQVLKAADEDDTSFTTAVWHAVGILIDLESKHPAETTHYSPPTALGEAEQVLMAKSQEAALKLRQIADKGDARGVLALLALSRGGCEMAQQAMTSLQTLRGLALALSEIPMLSIS